jgi:hypothetical protein
MYGQNIGEQARARVSPTRRKIKYVVSIDPGACFTYPSELRSIIEQHPDQDMISFSLKAEHHQERLI